MTERGLARLACRLLALYLLIQVVLSGLPALAAALTVLDMRSGSLADSLPGAPTTFIVLGPSLLTHLAVVIVLWRYAGPLAERLVPEQSEASGIPAAWSLASVHTVAFSVVGLIFAVQGLRELVSILAVTFTLGRDIWTGYLEAALQLGLGLWLLFGSSGLVQGVQALQRAGQKKSWEDDATSNSTSDQAK